jgi:hypothetical protein
VINLAAVVVQRAHDLGFGSIGKAIDLAHGLIWSRRPRYDLLEDGRRHQSIDVFQALSGELADVVMHRSLTHGRPQDPLKNIPLQFGSRKPCP